MKPLRARTEEIWPIERLNPNPRNTRVHSVEQVAQIAKSFEGCGITQPIVMEETDTVLAGHGKLLAARQLGLKEVPAKTFAQINRTHASGEQVDPIAVNVRIPSPPFAYIQILTRV